jgi:hypothetical protein
VKNVFLKHGRAFAFTHIKQRIFMERNQVLNEYWNLCKLLNQSNKLADEKTQVRFKIESDGRSEYRLLLEITGDREEHKIEIARKGRSSGWERSGYTNFKILELFCANFLNDLKAQELHSYENAAAKLQKYFDNLLVQDKF